MLLNALHTRSKLSCRPEESPLLETIGNTLRLNSHLSLFKQGWKTMVIRTCFYEEEKEPDGTSWQQEERKDKEVKRNIFCPCCTELGQHLCWYEYTSILFTFNCCCSLYILSLHIKWWHLIGPPVSGARPLTQNKGKECWRQKGEKLSTSWEVHLRSTGGRILCPHCFPQRIHDMQTTTIFFHLSVPKRNKSFICRKK